MPQIIPQNDSENALHLGIQSYVWFIYIYMYTHVCHLFLQLLSLYIRLWSCLFAFSLGPLSLNLRNDVVYACMDMYAYVYIYIYINTYCL